MDSMGYGYYYHTGQWCWNGEANFYGGQVPYLGGDLIS